MQQNIQFPRHVIHRKKLVERLVLHSQNTTNVGKIQREIIEIFREIICNGRSEVSRRFNGEKEGGLLAANTNSFLMDQVVRTLYEFSIFHVYPVSNPTAGEQISILATGGYGRQTLAPYSDVDLMFLLPYKLTAHSEQIIEFILYSLWDLGFKVGHATRSIKDAISLSKKDFTIRTSLLESRWLTGNRELYTKFEKQFMTTLVAHTGPEFVEAKLAERDRRHSRMGDSRYVLEPNVKEGKGGLRDLQTLYWIAKYLYRVREVEDLFAKDILTADDIRTFSKAEKFLWTVRFHIHYFAKRPEETLTFDIQTAASEQMGYDNSSGNQGVESFMKDYFLVAKDVGSLTRILCAVLEESHKKKRPRNFFPSFTPRKQNKIPPGFKLDGKRISFDSEKPFENGTQRILTLFSEAQSTGCDIHPSALRTVSQNIDIINDDFRNDIENNKTFINILIGPNPYQVLMQLNESGVFGAFVPEFGNVIAQMQYDMYHVYTVDEHTIRAIGILSDIENSVLKKDLPVSSEIIKEIQSRQVLFVAVLLHDIAKGLKGDHSEVGAKIAERLAPRFGLNDWETETVSWLVLHHLIMSRTAFKRDIEDPKTVADFADVVQSPERLRLLLILTVADIRAVGPNVWNSWKAALLRKLYLRTQEVLTGNASFGKRKERVVGVKIELTNRLKHLTTKWSDESVNSHLALGSDQYWLSFDLDLLFRHAILIQTAEAIGEKLVVEAKATEDDSIAEVLIYTADHPGLFSKIAAGIISAKASVVNAKVVTLSNGMALDTFWVRDTNHVKFTESARLSALCLKIRSALLKKTALARNKHPKSETNIFKVPHRVLIDNEASNSHTIIEINGYDRPGFLQAIAEGLFECGVQISSAHISTYGERVVDVFYVKDVFGLKIEKAVKHKLIRKALLNKLAPETLSAHV